MKQGEGGSAWMMGISNEAWSLCVKANLVNLQHTASTQAHVLSFSL